MAQLSTQELAIRKAAVLVNIPEEIVELVIAHKNKAMYEALYLYRSVEDSGLCKFSIRTNNVLKRIAKVQSWIDFCEARLTHDITEKEREKRMRDLVKHYEEKEYLESKI